MPSPSQTLPSNITDWTFQAKSGDLPEVKWFLDHLDRAGFPCSWRAGGHGESSHPAYRWGGHFSLATQQEEASEGVVSVQTYGPLDGGKFGVTFRACSPQRAETGRLLRVLANLVAQHFQGTCLTGNHILEGKEWCGNLDLYPTNWWETSYGRGEGLSKSC